MHATYWLIGCALCIVSVGVTATAAEGAQDMDSSAHTAIDIDNLHDSVSGSDVLGLTHDNGQRGTSSEAPSSASSSGGRAGNATTPTRIRQPHVGWQSLLPGSIQ